MLCKVKLYGIKNADTFFNECGNGFSSNLFSLHLPEVKSQIHVHVHVYSSLMLLLLQQHLDVLQVHVHISII